MRLCIPLFPTTIKPMNFLFSPNHVQLLNSCYPPTSALLTCGPAYAPNSQELSRLTYYASNHPGKLAKIGSELEKRLKLECRKAKAGNLRSRASLLISLAIFRALATECRRDIALLSSSLISSVDATLSAVPTDLEVVARVASVFTAWTTYSNGQLIGADRAFTTDYLSALSSWASLSDHTTSDVEEQNRTRLIGFAALTSAINSEALYNDTHQFRAQVATIMRPILANIYSTNLPTLDQQAIEAKESSSPYLSEFRTRPALERRAASIHLHIDGDKGPSSQDVCAASLRALLSLLEHANGSQLGIILRSAFDNLDELKAWSSTDHCLWVAQKLADWSQYQYRYAVPTWLVERMLDSEDSVEATAMHQALANMVITVLNSATPLINLSTSDIMTNFMTLVARRASYNPEDALLPPLVKCISALGTHVYYSDQIQDLAVEAINKLNHVEVQGVVVRGNVTNDRVRAEVIRVLLAGLVGLMHSADIHDTPSPEDGRKRSGSLSSPKAVSPSIDVVLSQDAGADERASRRTKISPDIWHETLSLLCDRDYSVRADYARALQFYISKELPKHPDYDDGLNPQNVNKTALVFGGDAGAKFLDALHAYADILLTTQGLGLSIKDSRSASSASTSDADAGDKNPVDLEERPDSPTKTERSAALQSIHAPRGRKISLAVKLLDKKTKGDSATLSDYTDVLDTIMLVHKELPVRGLLSGLPMLLALDAEEDSPQAFDVRKRNAKALMLAKVWLFLGEQWSSPELVSLAEEAIRTSTVQLPTSESPELGAYHPATAAVAFPDSPLTDEEKAWRGVDASKALQLLTSNPTIQEATGLDSVTLSKRFSVKWHATEALQDSYKRSTTYENTLREDGVSPLLKLTPSLMRVDNMSMQSLARSVRGVGVTDLREALEGRSSMSNPHLAGPPGRASSISTLDRPSSVFADSRVSAGGGQAKRPRKKRVVPGNPADVKDVLNRLGIGKQNGSLLKASFPALQREGS